MVIKAIILCGGQGTRLREETEFKPKPLVEIGDKPILWHIMKHYARHGIKDFVLCLGYKGEKIKEYFYKYEILNNDFTVELGRNQEIQMHGDHSEAGWRITLADTGAAALTGARVKRVEKYVDTELFTLTYGDGVSDIDIGRLLEFHRSHKKIGTVTGVHPQARFGELTVSNNRVVEFNEKPQINDGLINGGFFVFDKRFFRFLSDKDDCVLEKDPLERLAAEGELMVYQHKGFWQCMDTLRDSQYLNGLWNSGKAPWVTPIHVK